MEVMATGFWDRFGFSVGILVSACFCLSFLFLFLALRS